MSDVGQARELTFGEKAVGLTFNHGEGDTYEAIHKIKTEAAAVIDNLNNLRNLTDDGEKKRMYSLAITAAQESQMWAVKAVTWNS